MTENKNPTVDETTDNEKAVEPQAVVEKISVNEIKEEQKHQEQEKIEEELKNFNAALNDLVESIKSLTPEQLKQIVAEYNNKK